MNPEETFTIALDPEHDNHTLNGVRIPLSIVTDNILGGGKSLEDGLFTKSGHFKTEVDGEIYKLELNEMLDWTTLNEAELNTFITRRKEMLAEALDAIVKRPHKFHGIAYNSRKFDLTCNSAAAYTRKMTGVDYCDFKGIFTSAQIVSFEYKGETFDLNMPILGNIIEDEGVDLNAILEDRLDTIKSWVAQVDARLTGPDIDNVDEYLQSIYDKHPSCSGQQCCAPNEDLADSLTKFRESMFGGPKENPTMDDILEGLGIKGVEINIPKNTPVEDPIGSRIDEILKGTNLTSATEVKALLAKANKANSFEEFAEIMGHPVPTSDSFAKTEQEIRAAMASGQPAMSVAIKPEDLPKFHKLVKELGIPAIPLGMKLREDH